MTTGAGVLSRLLIGEPLRSDRLEETLLPKRLALPVFCSDPLSSVAYATEQILIVLGLGGLALLHLTSWVALAVVAAPDDRRRLVSADLPGLSERRRRLRGQPSEPGRERVADRRLGAADRLRAHRGGLGGRPGSRRSPARCRRSRRTRSSYRSGFVVVLTAMNLRGVKESGRAFAVPTYGFVLCYLRLARRRLPQAGLRRRDDGGERELPHQSRPTRHRRAADGVPRPAGFRVRLHRPDRRRGGLQRRARVRAAEEPATRRPRC